MIETLESFYGDQRRRDSVELRFGSGWRSSRLDNFEYQVFLIAATEELCLLRAAIRDVQSDGVFSRFVLGLPPHTNPRELRDHEVSVEVLARLPEDEVDRRLQGWETHLSDPGGIEWVRSVVSLDSDPPDAP